MVASKESLRLFAQLHQAGVAPPLLPGQFVGRGFADLGCEIFAVVPGEKIISIFTGKVVTLTAQDRAHLFWIPSCDDLVQQIIRHDGDIRSIRLVEQRRWEVAVATSAGSVHSTLSDRLESALAEALLGLIGTPR